MAIQQTLKIDEHSAVNILTVNKEESLDFLSVVYDIHHEGVSSTNRKGEIIYEILNAFIVLRPGAYPYCAGRFMSKEYLSNELDFYSSGSLKLEDAVKMSKFWAKCSDDGETINSNYGYLLFHKVNERGLTQFEYAISCLLNNKSSKKAVMTIHSPEHAYLSNDNPCTLNIVFRIINDELNMHVTMRSNDVWYGLPYDLPFFHVVHKAALNILSRTYPEIRLGIHVHQAHSLHIYERSLQKYSLCERKGYADEPDVMFYLIVNSAVQRFIGLYDYRAHRRFMNMAWEESKKSHCLKKHCGAVIVCHDKVVALGDGDRDGVRCTECARDKKEVFYSDGCYSVHAEMRASIQALKNGFTEWDKAVVYVTHGPCDACLKLLNHLGVEKVIYDKPYKTDYKGHWPNIEVVSLEELCVSVPPGERNHQ